MHHVYPLAKPMFRNQEREREREREIEEIMFCFGSVVSKNLCTMFCETKICSKSKIFFTCFIYI